MRKACHGAKTAGGRTRVWTVRAGLFLAYWPWFAPEEQVELAVLADELGLDSVWVSEIGLGLGLGGGAEAQPRATATDST